MEFAGITGFKYIELNYFNAPEDKLLPAPAGLTYDEIYVPSAPSMLSDAVQNISKSLENISKIRFDKISASLENSAAKINEFLDDDTFQETVANLRNITAKIDRGITDERVNAIICDLEQTAADFREISDNLNSGNSISKTVNSISDAGNSVSKTAENLESTLFKLNNTLDKLSILIDLLNENPSALIRGKEIPQSNIK